MPTCPFSPPGVFDPDFVRDPYPVMAAARRDQPVYWLDEFQAWVVTRYRDVRAVLRDTASFSNANAQRPLFPICEAALAVLRDGGFAPGMLTTSDGPVHARLRAHSVAALGMMPARLAELEPVIAGVANELIDGFAARGHADLVAELIYCLPARIIFDLIGFPASDHAQLQAWCGDRLQMFWGHMTAERQVASAEAMIAYFQYCLAFVARSSEALARGEVSAHIAATLLRNPSGLPDPLSHREIAGILYGLVFAGQETTAALIASLLRILLEDRAHWDALRRDRSLIEGAVEEALRIEPSIMAWRRITTRPVEIGGVAIPEGAQIILHLGSAGHDETMFPAAEQFDPHRPNASRHLAFGFGAHFCIGASLARLEIRVVLATLIDRFPALRLADPGQEFRYLPNLSFRGPTRLDVRWDA
jgi:cytochrome P450